MPEHFQSRNDMIRWLTNQCPRPAIVRALDAGRVEFLGGFTKIPPSNLPGWIFRVKMISGKIRNVVILANDQKLKYEIRIVKHVPWENWDRRTMEIYTPDWRLRSGDKPRIYIKLWELKNAEISARQINNS